MHSNNTTIFPILCPNILKIFYLLFALLLIFDGPLTVRAGGIYGKRAAAMLPYSGGIYGKRSGGASGKTSEFALNYPNNREMLPNI
ncbi:unnamed protein product [Meloidogyne enterolobii]|uniref:Uncharacterized protein n=1 Tax=Meloidogyne enterolobii TaxID=390850 RepID=A0ACB1AR87_MELEN